MNKFIVKKDGITDIIFAINATWAAYQFAIKYFPDDINNDVDGYDVKLDIKHISPAHA